jgi:RND family efflux transporter MFP subunit
MVTIIGVLFSCGENKEEVIVQDALKVEILKVKVINRPKLLQFTGQVEADDKMVLSTKILGRIDKISVKEGDQVKKGQLLIEINSNDIQSKLKSVKASFKEGTATLTNVKRNYDRISQLTVRGSATQRELDDITTAKSVAEARLESISASINELEELLTYANLKSPINGFVSQKYINVGDMASPGSPLLALESLGELKVTINVPSFEIGLLEENDQVTIKFDALENATCEGVIEKIVPSSAFSGAQYRVNVSMISFNKNVKPGMFARVDLYKNNESKILIPKNAIRYKGQLTGLFAVNQQDEAMLRWVRLGEQFPEGVEVLSGLIEGERIIISSDSKLIDGIKVETIKSI